MRELMIFLKDLCFVSFFIVGLSAAAGFVVYITNDHSKQCQIYLQNDPSLPIYREFIDPTELRK